MAEFKDQILEVMQEVNKVIFGKEKVVRKIMMAIIAGGHILIDDIPGVGKTTMASAFAKAMGLKVRRMQFTPDVLPSDITGFTIYNREKGEFEYREGAAMCNLFLADEINRTSPKTQSALLEVMEEGKITVDGVTRKLQNPFIVIATQNPAGSIGTQKLPESQLDRFMMKTGMGYPNPKEEVKILQGKRFDLMESVEEVITADKIMEIQKQVKAVYIEESVCMYIAEIARASREDDAVALGISPRGSVAISMMSKACAFMAGRNYVIPADIQDVLMETMMHRIILNAKARVNKVTQEDIIRKIITEVAVPQIKNNHNHSL